MKVTMLDKIICVIGLGCIGLPTASLLGTKGFQVHGVDVSEHESSDLTSFFFKCVKSRLDPLFLFLCSS